MSIISLASCTEPTPAPTPVSRPNVLLAIDGTARLKRDGWTDYTSMGFGTVLNYDDLLQVDGSVQILCGDLTLKTLQSGTDSCPCPPAPGRLEEKGSSYRNIPDNVPYVQHPRHTLVVDERPSLRWHDTGATSYSVAIVQGGEVVWQQGDVVDNALTYPVDAPTLQPGADYLLVVKDDDSGVESGADDTPGIGFRVASSAQQAALATHCGDVTTLTSLDGAQRDYALALCYATWAPEGGGRGPWGAALLLLESVAGTHDAPAVRLWMGDLWLKMQGSDDAETAYRAALQRAEVLGDVESQAAAHAGLWRATGEGAHRDAAITLYGQLGDNESADALR